MAYQLENSGSVKETEFLILKYNCCGKTILKKKNIFPKTLNTKGCNRNSLKQRFTLHILFFWKLKPNIIISNSN